MFMIWVLLLLVWNLQKRWGLQYFSRCSWRHRGVIVYMWVKIIDGEEVIVRGAYIESLGEVRIGTSFKPERGDNYVREWIQGTGADQIYP